MSASSVIALRGLSKRYGDVVALEGLDLEVAAGECVALIGHNGSGKTTTMRLAAGQLEPTSGSVTVAGIDIHRAPDAHRARAALAFVPDSPLLYDDLTVAEHLELVGLAHGVGDALDERIAVLLDVLDLRERRDFLPVQLSRGMRQKTQIACTLVRPFQVLLLDEPVVGLDPPSQASLRELLEEAKAASAPPAGAAVRPAHRRVRGGAVRGDRGGDRLPADSPETGERRRVLLADRRGARADRRGHPAARPAGGAAPRHLAGAGGVPAPGRAVAAQRPDRPRRAGPATAGARPGGRRGGRRPARPGHVRAAGGRAGRAGAAAAGRGAARSGGHGAAGRGTRLAGRALAGRLAGGAARQPAGAGRWARWSPQPAGACPAGRSRRRCWRPSRSRRRWRPGAARGRSPPRSWRAGRRPGPVWPPASTASTPAAPRRRGGGRTGRCSGCGACGCAGPAGACWRSPGATRWRCCAPRPGSAGRWSWEGPGWWRSRPSPTGGRWWPPPRWPGTWPRPS